MTTTHGEDLFWFCVCIFAFATIHRSAALVRWALHFLFTAPKNTGIRMEGARTSLINRDRPITGFSPPHFLKFPRYSICKSKS